MASYTKIVNRYRGGDAIWTNQSNASTIIVNDFFETSNDPEPPIDGSATVTTANIILSSNAIIAKGSANGTVSLATISIQSNSIVGQGNAIAIASVANSVVNVNNVTAKGSSIGVVLVDNVTILLNNVTVSVGAIAQVVTVDLFTNINSVTAKGDANAFISQLNALLSVNGISAKGSGTAFIETSNITFTALDFVIVAPIIDVVANVNTANITIKLNNVIAYQLDVSKNEVLLCVSIVINKIEFNSQIKNEIIWETYISNKLILQSHY